MEVDPLPSLDDKIAFFAQLEACARVDDSSNCGGKNPDTGGACEEDEFDVLEEKNRELHRRFFKPAVSPLTAKPGAPGTLLPPQSLPTARPSTSLRDLTPRRIVSAPVPEANILVRGTGPRKARPKGTLGELLSEREGDVVHETPQAGASASSAPTLKRVLSSVTAAAAAAADKGVGSPSLSAAATRQNKKRKRTENTGKSRPEKEKIFKGLSFFYVPDNDIAMARRLRINKAKEYGAVWTRSVAAATHVVVEKNLSYKDVEGMLPPGDKGTRAGGLKVVSEEYPIDCIQFGAVLDHTQKKYMLVGQPAVNIEGKQVEEVQLVSSGESVVSLQLKPQHRDTSKWDYVPPRGTPPQVEEQSQIRAVVEDSQPVVVIDMDRVTESPKRELDEPPSKQDQNLPRRSDEEVVSKQDELAGYISMMQEFKDLPLDADEDDARSTVGQLEGQDDDDEDHLGSEGESPHRRRSTRKIRPTRKAIAFEDRFACNRAGTKEANAENPNSRTIEILQKMKDYYERVNDHWRTLAYRKAISVLKRQDVKISTEEEAYHLPNIGRRLAQKIEEIVMTDKLTRLEYAEDDPTYHAMEAFLKIYGVGNRQAEQWIAQGFRTLEDVKTKARLNPNQRMGVEHYDDLNTRIPRREVSALGEVVKKASAEIDPAVELIVGGSYRRGAESSNDIDFIVTKPGTTATADLKPFLDKLTQKLKKDKFLVAELASSRVRDGSMWHGCCVLPKAASPNDGNYKPTWRRIDLLLVPETEMGGALIYFTGDDIFNRSIRLLASKKGMRLNQRGLYREIKGGADRGTTGTEGELLEGRDEARIFEILGVKWREPHERWC